MDREKRERLISGYLDYLAYLRVPADVPTQRHAEYFARNPHWHYWDEFYDFIGKDPEFAWNALLEIIERCHEDDLKMLGAGDLESFLFENAPAFAERYERQLRTNPRFFKAFRSVYMGGIPERIWRHLNDVLADLGVAREKLAEWWTDDEQYPDK